MPTLSCGHACTQSRQKVQSRLPRLVCWNSQSSQPFTTPWGAMQSLVVHRVQRSTSRALTSNGETIALTKLNCPMGHTYLQNAAPLNRPSMANAATKYARMTHAVNHGLAHRLKAS